MKTMILIFSIFFCSSSVFGSVIPKFEVIKTKNNVTVYFFPNSKIPIFQAELLFEGGGDLDPKNKSGLGSFTSNLMTRGVKGLDENAFSRRVDDLAAGVDVSVGQERFVVSGFGLNEYADEILKLMFAQVTEPTFAEAPFRRIKKNSIDALKQLPDSAEAIADRALDLILFNGTTKARPVSGFDRDLKNINLKEAYDHYLNFVRTDKLNVLVIGGKDRNDILDKVIRRVESLECKRCGKPRNPPQSYTYKTFEVPKDHVVLIDRPGVTEAHVAMGFVGPKRKIPEFYDLRVAETVLSGNFGSRLNMIIREKMALTYGISAGFSFGLTTGTFNVSTSTRTEKIGEMMTQVQELLTEFVKDGVTDQELAFAKDYITGAYPLSLQNMYSIASAYFRGVLNGLDPEFMDAYEGRINAVSRDSVQRALQRYMHLDQMRTVIAGDLKKIAPELRRHGIRFVVRPAQLFL